MFNVLGTTLMNDGSMLAMTTLGNLGASNIDYIEIPGCDNSKYQVEQCRLSKFTNGTLTRMNIAVT